MVAATQRRTLADAPQVDELRTVDDDVNVTASMRPRVMVGRQPAEISCTGTAGTRDILDRRAMLPQAGGEGFARLALGMSTRAARERPAAALNQVLRQRLRDELGGTRAGTTPRTVSASAVASDGGDGGGGKDAWRESPRDERSNTICTAFWLVNKPAVGGEAVSAARNRRGCPAVGCE